MTIIAHRRPLIDAHVHIHPAKAAGLAEHLDAAGVERVVNLGILELLDIPFQEGLDALRRALGKRLVYFSAPDFRDNSSGFGRRMAEALERQVEGGAGGLKIFKELGLRHQDAAGQLIPVDDPRLDPLWAKAGALGVPVLIHTADPLAFFQPLDEHNERREELERHPDWHFGTSEFPDHDTLLAQRNRVLDRHSGTVFIGAHLGNYAENLAYVDACLERYPNFSVDTSARIGEIGRHPASEVRAFFEKHQDRVLFGTDLVRGWDTLEDEEEEHVGGDRLTGFYDTHRRFFETETRQMEYPGFPLQGRWTVEAIALPDEVLDKLYTMNARRLIPALGG